MFLIDTSIWIFVLGPRALEPLRDRVSSIVLDNKAATTLPILFEILQGARTIQDAEALKQRMRSLHVLPYLESDWSDAAEWGARLTRKGITAKSMDLLIAFKAHQSGMTLLHADRDFDRMAHGAHLKVESWVSRILHR